VVRNTQQADLAKKFRDLVTGKLGQQTLQTAGVHNQSQ
jgi:hypothetical protein